MVLLAGSNLDLSNLWDWTGGYNDLTGIKHTFPIRDIITEGNFRSALVDNWTMKQFNTVSVCGMNSVEDIFWEAEFNVTNATASLPSWLSIGTMTSTSTIVTNQADIVWGGGTNYRVRFTNVNEDTSWFAVTSGTLSYPGMPQIYAHAKPLSAFREPAVLDGNRGCWSENELVHASVVTTTSDMMPAMCINLCWDHANVAFLRSGNWCNCANITSSTIPQDESYCNLPCAGDNNFRCGSLSTDYGNAYHVQGPKLPGEQNIMIVYHGLSTIDAQYMFINENDAGYNDPTGPHYITEISVAVAQSLLAVTYTVTYSSENCSTANATMSLKVLNLNPFQADNTRYEFTILKVRCTVLLFSAPVEAVIQMYGPEVNGFVNVPALVIRGMQIIPDASTPNTSQMASSTVTIVPSNATSSTTGLSSTSQTQTTMISTLNESPTSTSSPTSTVMTTQSSVTSKTSLSSHVATSTTVPSICWCYCNETIQQLNMTAEELKIKIAEIQKRLLVNVSQLSSTIRKLTSAKDERPSAISIGSLGVGVLVFMLGSIIFIDSSMLVRDFKKLFHNLRNSILCPSPVRSRTT